MDKLKNNKKRKMLIAMIVLAVILIIAGVSYALWSYTENQDTINKINSDCLKIELTDESDAINLEEIYPITDEDAEELTPYKFKIENVCTLSVTYDVNLEIMDIANRLSSKYIAAEFNGQGKKLLSNYPSATPTYDKSDYTAIESYGLTSGVLNKGESISYTIKLWIDESTPATTETMNKDFVSKITVNASLNQVVDAYTESILNGADPVLAENLIPVVIADDGTVTKANIETEWYNYEDKVWANAVILEDETITYNNYDVIPESNIESYFVWIPRYKYKIWDEGQYTELTTVDTEKVHTIQVEFETTDVEDSTGSTVNSWLTHPAFTSFDVNGLWVGKFESGYKGATIHGEALSNTSEPEKLQIKPNVYSWQNINVSNAHLTSYNYKREMDSHMMKNTEWGAVAYLQHSAYGSQQSVRINNNSAFKTGYSAITEPTAPNTEYTDEESIISGNGTKTYTYNTETGYLASTTGNISGIYDMSGGASEYVMGVMSDQNGNPLSGENDQNNSGFKGLYSRPEGDILENTEGVEWPEEKYYDLYSYTTIVGRNFANRILGDATGEMGPFQTDRESSWYGDISVFVSTYAPWFIRGGRVAYGVQCGMFASHSTSGYPTLVHSYRVVLAI